VSRSTPSSSGNSGKPAAPVSDVVVVGTERTAASTSALLRSVEEERVVHRPMRILVITNMYPPHHLGGYELSCRDVVERWRAWGHEVTILTSDTRLSGVDDPAGEHASGVRRDLGFYWRDHEIVSPPLLERLRMERRNQASLRRAIDDVRPDIVSAWHMGAMSLGLLTSVERAGIPIALVVCDDWMLYAPDADAWMRATRRLGPLSSIVEAVTGVPVSLPGLRDARFCFVSAWIRDRAIARSRWQTNVNTIAYTGIDRRDFPIATPSDRPWGGRLLCASRIEERKGVHIAIEALTHLEDATLVVCGPAEEAYAARLRALVGDLGLDGRVTFTMKRRDELRAVYADADAFLFPVLWTEPFGLVPVEAMACGTPVVGTIDGGSREFMIDGVNCIGVPPGDAVALAGAISDLAAGSAKRDRLVRAGLLTAQELSVDRYAEVLERWHIATAEGTDTPPHRPSIAEALAAKGLTPA
jgi:glycogen(starch) synthase